MKLALAQINPIVGDIDGNAALMRRFIDEARVSGVELLVFPELALCGYPPNDLLLQEGFLDRCVQVGKELGAASAGMTVVFGTPLVSGGEAGARGTANSLLVYQDGKFLASYDKRLLPTYDVFDEDRYFEPGDRAVVVDVGGVRVGLSICEDLWKGEDVGFASRYRDLSDPVAALAERGVDLIVNPSASPFVLGKGRRHREILKKHAMRHGVVVAAVNQVGGNDELIFDGHAAVFGADGILIAAGPGFAEKLVVVDLDFESVGGKKSLRSGGGRAIDDPLLLAADEELLYRSLVLGVRDYLRKTGFKSVVLGLSGGIDSAVTAVIGAAALGAANVLGVSLPSRYSSEGSKTDAAELAANLGMRMETIAIEDAFASMLDSLSGVFAGRAPDVAEENLQSRIRGTLLMGLSNKFGHLLLTTGNKSELAVGYCTLYGDMNGGLAVLSDVTKEWVYKLARWMNENSGKLEIAGLKRGPIPEASITKPPSAELRPGQTDQDSLPPYAVLDEIVERYVEKRESPSRIVRETGFDQAVVARCVRLIDLSEFKRKQAAIGLKVTGLAFGSGRRVPIAQKWRPSANA